MLYACAFGLITNLFTKTGMRQACFLILGLFATLVYFVQMVYYSAFNHFAMVDRLMRTKELVGVKDMLGSFFRPSLYLFIIPIVYIIVIAVLIKRRKQENGVRFKEQVILFLLILTAFAMVNTYYLFILKDANKQELQNSTAYASNYGILDLLAKDISRHILFQNSRTGVDDLDLILEFAIKEDTNLMTDIYIDKNIVFITAESLGTYGISEAITPTLYRLQQEGLNFSEYYASTANTLKSEYATLTSFPLSATREEEDFSSNGTMPTLFRNKGYKSLAFHNYYSAFYDRSIQHINLGFETFYGSDELGIDLEGSGGQGENLVISADDSELFEKTFPLYASYDKFFAYHMTVSGHGPYDLERRPNLREDYEMLAKKLPNASSEVLTYHATNQELEKGVNILLADLEANNLLDDTVIVLLGDHYPYGLSEESLLELTGNIDGKFDLEQYKVPFFIWDASMPTKDISTVMSNVDVLPTLSNMFDLDVKYGFGQDVFSVYADEIIVEWQNTANFSFMIEEGGYDFSKKKNFGNLTQEKIEQEAERSYRRARWNDEPFVLNGFV
ncbi:hypothetical protein AwErysi_09920 [Erysipelotrichaceae bacterium]|nr:hypothetical protein AwErysi_09920 [Erysipelotrichaceae bacterium]